MTSHSQITRRLRRAAQNALLAAALGTPVVLSGACSKAPLSAQGSSKPASAASIGWKPKTRYVYDLNLKSSATLAQNAQPLEFQLTGVLELIANSDPHAKTTLHARLKDVRLQAQNPELAPNPEHLAHSLESTWGFTLSEGRVTELRAPQGTPPFSAGILRTVAAALQHPAPSKLGAPLPGNTVLGETVQEVDASGTYTARYDEVAPGTYKKTKLGYSDVQLSALGLSATPVNLTPAVRAFSGELRVSQGTISSVNWDETLEVTPALATTVRSHSQVKLELLRGEAAEAPDWEVFRASTPVLPSSAPVLNHTAQSQFDRARTHGRSYEQLLTSLNKDSLALKRAQTEKPNASPDNELLKAQSETVRALGALLRIDSARIREVERLARRGDHMSPGLLDAMAIAGTPDAQAVLAKLSTAKNLDPKVRLTAAQSLIRTQWPSAGSVDALIGWLRNDGLRVHALYGLGSFSRHLRDSGQHDAARKAAEALLAELPESRLSQRVHVLRGISNSGYSGAFEAVRALINDPDTSIRAAAIEAVRFMDRPEVDAVLVDQLRPELALEVRLAAINAASVRTPSDALVSAVSGLATGAPEAQGRMKAVQLLERWLRARPEVRSTLQQVAEKDDEREGVRRIARAALAI